MIGTRRMQHRDCCDAPISNIFQLRVRHKQTGADRDRHLLAHTANISYNNICVRNCFCAFPLPCVSRWLRRLRRRRDSADAQRALIGRGAAHKLGGNRLDARRTRRPTGQCFLCILIASILVGRVGDDARTHWSIGICFSACTATLDKFHCHLCVCVCMVPVHVAA